MFALIEVGLLLLIVALIVWAIRPPKKRKGKQ
jgi:hypothetical protein